MKRRKGVYLGIVILSLTLCASISSCGNQVKAESGPSAESPVPHEEGQEALEGHADGEEHEAHSDIVSLTAEQMENGGIRVAEAGPGMLSISLTLPGQVKLNADRVAHVVPRIPGVVREVTKSLGDEVKGGEVMAVLDSRELADLKAGYLASREREALAEAMFTREEGLWKKKISAEQDYLGAKNAVAEARIATRTAEQQLHAIGFSEEYVSGLSGQSDISLTRYAITAPFDGTIIDKHITLGEALKEDVTAFVVADLSTVWVDLSVYQKDLPLLQEGQQVTVEYAGEAGVQGTISYIGPVMGEESKTFTARVVLNNPEGNWRPGLFVTGIASVDQIKVDVLIPKTAVQTVEDRTVVFVQQEQGFAPVPIVMGRSSASEVEVVEGLAAGQRFAAEGSFLLKATLEKAELGHEH